MDWPPDAYHDHEDERPKPDHATARYGRDRFSEAVGDAWESAIWQDRNLRDDAE